MERYAWRAKVLPGMQDEYKKRHDDIWPEMKQLLKQAGIRNYSIWLNGEDLFGYYECEQGIGFASKAQAGSPVVEKWNEYMKDVMRMEMDPVTHAQPLLQEMFYLA